MALLYFMFSFEVTLFRARHWFWSKLLVKLPESKIAMTVPLPSYSGYLLRKEVAPVSARGCKAQTGNFSRLSDPCDIFLWWSFSTIVLDVLVAINEISLRWNVINFCLLLGDKNWIEKCSTTCLLRENIMFVQKYFWNFVNFRTWICVIINLLQILTNFMLTLFKCL